VELHRPVRNALRLYRSRQLPARPSPSFALGWFAVRSCAIGKPERGGFGVLLRFVAGARAPDYFSTGGLSCLTLLLATVFVSCGLVVVLIVAAR
jgi:hypothetical protein